MSCEVLLGASFVPTCSIKTLGCFSNSGIRYEYISSIAAPGKDQTFTVRSATFRQKFVVSSNIFCTALQANLQGDYHDIKYISAIRMFGAVKILHTCDMDGIPEAQKILIYITD